MNEEPSDALSDDQRDIALMQLVKAGDVAAFETLVEAHQMKVIGTVAKMLGDDRDAEDIAQLVFLRVWRSAARYRPTAKFTTWLFTITRNLVFNEIRRRKRRPALPLEAQETNPATEARDTATSPPDASLLESELQDAIESALAALPETQRMALVLRRYEELPYEDIATVLDQTVPAVKSLLFRARTELRARLADYLRS